MAANTVISASVRVTSDTKEARESLGQLASQVNTLANNIVLKTDSSELKKGTAAAQDLNKALQSAMNVNTGKLDLSKFSASLRAAGTDLNTLRESLVAMGPQGVQAFNAVSQAIASTGQSTIQVNKHFQNLWTNLKKTASWQISSTIIHKFSAKLQEAVHYAMDLNNSLNDIQRVTGMTDHQMSSFAQSAQVAAKNLSASTLAFTDAAKIYFQQGDNMSTAMQKAQITMKAANISFSSSAKEMSEYLTAIWNSYQVGTDQLEHYVDIMAALGAKTATSMEEISTALQKVAATANNVGVGMEQMSAIIATGASVTRQSAETIGTSWNTILSRLGGLKLGQTLEDGVDLNKYSKALNSIGVNVLDANGELRDMGKVIDEVGNKWSTLSKAQQSALAQTIGGARQYTQMMAFFDNYDTYKINVELADNASGELEKQNAIWEQSTEAAIGRVKNAWQGLYSELVDDKAINGLISGFAEILNGVTSVIDKMGGLVPLIGLIAGTFVAKLGSSGEASKSIEKLVSNFKVMTGLAQKDDIKMLNDNATAQQGEAERQKSLGNEAASAKAAGLAAMSSTKAQMIKNHTWNEENEAKMKAKEEALEAQTKELAEMEEAWKKAQAKQESGAKARQTDSARAARMKNFVGEDRKKMLEGTLEVEGVLTPEEAEREKEKLRAKATEMEDRKARAATMRSEGDELVAKAAEMRAAARPAVEEVEHQQQLKANEITKAEKVVQLKEESKARQESQIYDTMSQMDTMKAAGQEETDEYAELEKKLEGQIGTLDKIQSALDRKRDALETLQLEQMELDDKKAALLEPAAATERAGKMKQEDADAATKEADDFLSKVDDMEAEIEGDLETRKIKPKLQLDVKGIEADSDLGQAQKEMNDALVDAIASASEEGGEETLAEAEAKIDAALSNLIAKCDEAIKAATIKIGELQEQEGKLDNLLSDDNFGAGKEGWDANVARRQAGEIMGIKRGEGETDEAYDARLSEAGFKAEDYRDKETARSTIEGHQVSLREQAAAEDAKIDQAKKLATAAGEDADKMVADNSGLADVGDGAGRIAEAREQVDELNQSIEELGESPVKAADAFAELGGGITGAVTSGIAAVAGLKTAFDSSASAGERITGVIAAAGAAFAAYTNIVKVAHGIQKLHTAWQQADTVATAANTAAQNGQKVSFVQKLGAVIANVLGINTDTAATNVNTAATIANKLAKLGLVGAIIAAVAAVGVLAAVMITAIANATNYDKQLAELDSEMAELTARSNELEAKSQSNAEAMQKLATVTQDTTMTLEEQVAAINEIAGAYGVQVTALDVLSGRYETLAEEMHAAMASEQQEITAELEAIHVKQQENVQQHVEVLAKKETSVWTRIVQWVLVAWKHVQAVGLNIKGVFLTLLSGINDIRGYFKSFIAMIIRGLGTIVSFIVKIPETIANAFIKMVNAVIDAINSINIFGWSPNIKRLNEVHWSDDVANAFNAAADAMDASAQAAHDLAAAQREEAAAAHAAAADLRREAAELQEQFHAANIMRAAGQATNATEISRWTNLMSVNKGQNAKALEELGFRWDGTKVAAIAGKEQDWSGLYQFIEEFGAVDWGEYGAKLGGFLDSIGADELADTDRQLRQSRLSELMYTQYAEQIDALNLRHEEHDFNDVYDLIQQMGGEKGLNATDQAYVAHTLSGYSNWAGGQKFEAAVQLGLKVSDFNVANGLSQTEMTNQLLQAIYEGSIDGHTIDVDTALRIRPSAIQIDATGVHVDDSAVEAAITKNEMSKKQDRLLKIEAVQKADKGGIIDKAQYQALWESGAFETQEDLWAYASQSPEARALQMRQEQQELENELIQDNITLIHQNQADLVSARQALKGYYDELGRYLQSNIDSGEWTEQNHAWAFDTENHVALQGEALTRAFETRGSALKSAKTAQSSYRSQYNSDTTWDSLKGDDNEAARNAWRDALSATLTPEQEAQLLQDLGIDATRLSTLDEDQLKKVFDARNNYTEYWTEQNAELREMNTYLERGIELQGEYSAIQNEISASQNQIDINAWDQRVQSIEKATKAAEAFEKAMTKLGSLSATDLTALQEYDENALTNYQSMNSSEWAQYAHDQAEKYYNEQMVFYSNDAAKLAELNQKKEALNKTYYDNLKKQADAAAKAVEDARKKEMSTIQNALSEFQNALSGKSLDSFSGIEKLKQSLLEVGYTAEEVDRIIRNIGKTDVNTDEPLDVEALWANAATEIQLMLKGQEQQVEQLQEAQGLATTATNTMTVDIDVTDEARPLWDFNAGDWRIVAENPEYVTTAGQKYAFIAGPDGTMYGVTVNEDGSFNDPQVAHEVTNVDGSKYCFVAGPNGTMYGVTINTDGSFGAPTATTTVQNVDGSKYLFFTDTAGNMYGVTVNADGSFGNPTATTSVQDSGGRRYVFSTGEDGQMHGVSVNADGSFGNPVATTSVQDSGGRRYVFFTDEAGQMYGVTVNDDGSFSNPVATTDVQDDGGRQYCFFTGPNGQMHGVTINEDGSFGSPTATTPVQNVNGSKYCFFAGQNGSMYGVTVNEDGSFGNPTAATTLQNVDGSKYCFIAGPEGTMYGVQVDADGKFVKQVTATEPVQANGEKYVFITDTSGVKYSSRLVDGVWTPPTPLNELPTVSGEKYAITVDSTGAVSAHRYNEETGTWIPVGFAEGDDPNASDMLTISSDATGEDISFIYDASTGTWRTVKFPDGTTAASAKDDLILGVDLTDESLAMFWDPHGGPTGTGGWKEVVDTGCTLSTGLSIVADEDGNYYSVDAQGHLTFLNDEDEETRQLLIEAGVDLAPDTQSNVQSQLNDMQFKATLQLDTVQANNAIISAMYDRKAALMATMKENARGDAAKMLSGETLWDRLAATYSYNGQHSGGAFADNKGNMGYARKYAYATMISDILGQNADYVREHTRDIGAIISDLTNIRDRQGASEDTKLYAQFLIDGLVQGLRNYSASINWDDVTKDTADPYFRALRHALGISSPSKYTIEMGHYLMEGLSVGFQTTEFDPGEGFATNILDKIKNSLRSVRMEDVWKDLGWDQELIDAFNDEAFTGEEAQINFERLLGSENADAAGNYNGALNVFQKRSLLAYANAHLGEGETAYESFNDAWKAGRFNNVTLAAVQGYNNSQNQESWLLNQTGTQLEAVGDQWRVVRHYIDENNEQQTEIITELQDSREAALNALAVGVYGSKQFEKYLRGDYLQDSSLNAVQKALMGNLITEALSQLQVNGQTYTNLNDYLAAGGSWDDFFNEFNSRYQDSLDAFENTVDLTWANIKDSVKTVLDQIDEYDEQKAQAYYDRWVTIFEAINQVRQNLASGDTTSTLIDQLTDDKLDPFVRKLQEEGKTRDQIWEILTSSTWLHSAEARPYLNILGYDTSGYSQTGITQDLNQDAFGRVMFTTADEARDNRRRRLIAEYNDPENTAGRDLVNDQLQGALNLLNQAGDQILNWATDSVFWESQGFASAQEAQEQLGLTEYESRLQQRNTAIGLYTSRDNEGSLIGRADETSPWQWRSQSGELLGDLTTDFVQSVMSEIIDMFYLSDITDASVTAGMRKAWIHEARYQSDTRKQVEAEANNRTTKLQSDQSLVQKAMESGIKSLTATERAELDALMEEGGWDTLEEANMSLASSIDDTTAALWRMRQALNEGWQFKEFNAETGEATYYRNVDADMTFNAQQRTWQEVEYRDRRGRIVENPGEYRGAVIENMVTQTESMDDALARAYAQAEAWLQSTAGQEWNQAHGGNAQIVPVYSEDGSTVIGYKVQGTEELTEADLTSRYGNPQGTEAGHATADAQEYMYKTWATQAGFSGVQELEEYADRLVAAKKMVQMSREEMLRMAKSLARMQKGFKTASTDLEKLTATLKEGKTETVEYSNAVESLRDIYGDIFDLDEWGLDHLSEQFLSSAENADLLAKAVKGDETAFDSLAKKAALDLMDFGNAQIFDPQNVIANVGSVLDDIQTYLNNNTLEVGADLNDAPFWAKIAAMEFGSAEAAQAMSAALSTVGVDADVVPKTRHVAEKRVRRIITGTFPVYDGNGVTGLDYTSEVVDITPAHDETYWVLEGAKYNGRANAKPYAPSNTSGGGGGGGGGKKEVKEKKKRSDEIERYHVILDMLDAQKQRLEEIDKLKSRTYGGKHIAELNREIEGLKREAALQQEYLRQINEYLPSDQAAIAALGAVFNDDGTIANYEQVMNAWLDELDAAYDRYNMSAQEDADKEALEAAEKEYEERKKILEQYEETLDLAANEYNNLLEIQNKISQAAVDRITYKVDLVVDLNEADMKVIEYFIDKMEDVLHLQDEMFEEMISKAAIYEENLATYNKALEELEEEHRKFLDSNGQEGINDADYAEELANYREEIVGALEDIEKLRKEILDVYADALKKADEELEKHTKVIEHANKVAGEYIELMGLMGHAVDYRALEQFYNLQYESGIKNLEVQRAWVDELEKEIKYYQRRMDAGHQLTETEQKQWEDLVETYTKAHEDMLSQTKETLTDLQKAHEEYVNAIMKDLSKVNVANHNDLQDVADAYSYWNEQSNLYLATGKQLYEISKLNRSIEESIMDTTTQASKERLAALQEVINAQAESNQLTDYQIQQYQLQYQLALALQQLEEAGNKKSTVRLTRDENGNYGYQYTADQDSVDAARQNYEDVLEQIRNLTVTHANDMANAYIQARQNLESKLAELDESDFASHEEYLHARDEILQHYTELMDYYGEQYQLVTGDMVENLAAITEWYGYTEQTHMDLLAAALDEDIQAMIDGQALYEQALRESIDEIDLAWQQYTERIEQVQEISNVNYSTMTESIEKYNDMINKANEAALNTMDTIDDTLEGIHDATQEWDNHAAAVQGVISKYEALIQTLGSTLRGMQNLQAGFSSATTSYSVTTPTVKFPQTGSSSTGGTSGTSGTSGTDGNKDSEQQKTPKWYATYESHVGSGGKTGKKDTEAEAKAAGEAAVRATYTAWRQKYPSAPQAGLGDALRADLASVKTVQTFKTGGLNDVTGPAWLDGTKSRPELVLNADDTQVMLNAVKVIRTLTPDIMNLLSSNALGMMLGVGISTPYTSTIGQDLQQNVQIQAEFPNVTDHNEIEMAFNDLINQTTQYIHRH